MEEIATQHCPELLNEAEAISERFQTAFTLFRNCHDIYDKKNVDVAEVDLLGQY